jgi:STE24 endopeptidase
MNAQTVTVVFAFAVLAWLGAQLWLSSRQVRHVAKYRAQVPAGFAAHISLEAHQRAADYTIAKERLGIWQAAFGAVVLVGWTLLGGLDWLNQVALNWVLPQAGPMAYQLALITGFALVGSLLDLPFDAWRHFKLEQRFGFNRMTPGLWLADLGKGLLVSLLLGLPLAAVVLWLMGAAGALWWIWAWLALVGFNLLMLVVFPAWIAPWFNRFEPLQDAALAERVQRLMARCGFKAQGLFVMDGSRRSAHANAYFTGLGAAKRVVFYDTLLRRLSPTQVEAVLAHELGHFKLRHIPQRMVTLFLSTLAALALLGWLGGQSGFYAGLGVAPNLGAPNDALALLLFLLASPPFTFFLTPLGSALSRRHEFEADAFARQQADGAALAQALIKLQEDNAATLTPDPIFVRFHYSHPPTTQRLAALSA